MELIIVIAIGIALGLIKAGINLKIFHRDAYEKLFVCPNCGAQFYPKWYKLMYKANSVYTYNAAHLRCPICRKKDMCSLSHDEKQ